MSKIEKPFAFLVQKYVKTRGFLLAAHKILELSPIFTKSGFKKRVFHF